MDAAGFPTSRIIKIRGNINVNLDNGAITIPNGVSIVGDTISRDGTITRPKITILGSGTNLFTITDGVSFKDLLIVQDSSANISDSLIKGTTISNLSLINCHIQNIKGSGGIDSSIIHTTTALNKTLINNCFIDFGSTTSSYAIVLNSDSSITDVNFINSKITSTNPDRINTFILTSSLTNFFMNGCQIECSTSNSSNSIIFSTTQTNIQITNCNWTMGVNSGSSGGAIEVII